VILCSWNFVGNHAGSLAKKGKRKILRIREKRQGQRRRENVGSRRFRRLDIQSCYGREGDETGFSGALAIQQLAVTVFLQ
jgi:hypothetical protein